MDRHEIYRFDDFQVDTRTWRLSRAGREIHLEPTVLELLVYLISHREQLVTRRELMDTVWGETVISDAALSKAVARLRKALQDDPAAPRHIETVHSRGYRFISMVEGQSIRSIAVLPLKNLTGDPEQDSYADGLHDLLITELYRLPGLSLIHI